MSIVIIVLLIVNIFGFLTVTNDKDRAKKRKWRIAEKVFFIISVFGGSLGVFAGLLIFRHKTRHWKFMLGIPIIFIFQIIIFYIFLKYFN